MFSLGAPNSCGILITDNGKKYFVFSRQKTDKPGKVLILDITLDADKYVLINLYNANTETERVKILEELVKINALSLQMILISFLIKS